jgi:ribosomal protein L7/L12
MSSDQGTSSSLPQAVIEAISRNRKVEAIRLLREERNIDLKDAKEEVDRFIRENPALSDARGMPKEEGALGRFFLLIILILLAAAGYYLFA